jgi:ABC-2 type transport system ATP-binding protein
MKSLTELYKIGSGPSSSHTMGPEKAARVFRSENPDADRFRVILYGSLAKTGKGHMTDQAVLKALAPLPADVAFVREPDFTLPHPNTMDLLAFKGTSQTSAMRVYSVGAGKSTTVKVMSGILTPDGGECRICGRVPWRERVAHVSGIGVVFGQRSQLWWDVPVGDSFRLLKDIYNIPAGQYGERLRELSEALEIGQLLKTPARQLSLGQRMRCELAAALLHRPKILFLDEPTIGLDAVSKLALRAYLKEENRRSGVTILLTTHDMDDIEALCSRVMVIGRGRKLYDGPMQTLREKYTTREGQDIDEIIAEMYRDMELGEV